MRAGVVVRRLIGPLCVTFAAWSSSLAAELPSVIQKIKPSIVAVGTVEKTRQPPSKFRGTGFVVGNGTYVVTNAHVVRKELNEQKKEYLAVFAGQGQGAEIRVAVKVAEDTEHDIALLKIAGAALPALQLGDSQQVREGELYAFTGYPIGTVLGLHPVTHRGIVSAITPIVIPADSSKRLNAKLIARMMSPYSVFQLDATAYPGNSGSPLYDPNTGDVVGVVNMVFVKESKESALTDPSGITYAMPAQYVKRLLETAGVGLKAR